MEKKSDLFKSIARLKQQQQQQHLNVDDEIFDII